MPLVHAFTDDEGRDYPASYWRLDNLAASRETMSAVFVFSGWASNAARLAGKRELPRRSVRVTGSAFVAIFGPAATVNVFDAGENAALLDPQFAGATKV